MQTEYAECQSTAGLSQALQDSKNRTVLESIDLSPCLALLILPQVFWLIYFSLYLLASALFKIKTFPLSSGYGDNLIGCLLVFSLSPTPVQIV